ncbi:MAG: DNA repair protein RadC [Oscillibacter sp.]|nr:DNA repair protein RadC [Oscillibacter sp.]
MGVHTGHRERKKDQFLRCGSDSFADHELLELLLFYAIPQRDTNPIAHELMERFGSLQAVLSASPEELMEVSYIKQNAAVLLRLVPSLCQRALVSEDGREVILSTPEQIGEFFQKVFMAHSTEVMYQLCLDAKGKKKGLFKVSEGDVSSVGLNIRQIVENALRCKAIAVVMAHNHPSGLALPSHEDEIATRLVREALDTVEIQLYDHIIVADNDYVSMAQSGLL